MNKENYHWSNTYKKASLYILSLSLLFLFFIIITIDIPVCFGEQCEFIGTYNLIERNTTSIIFIGIFIYSVFCYLKFKSDVRQTPEIPFKITKIESINYEHLTFLATYVIPLITFDLEKTKYIFVLVLLLAVMGVIYIKTDLFYANPSLALLGFHIYKVSGEFKGNQTRDDIIVITRQKLKNNDLVRYIKLDDRIYYSDYKVLL